MSSQPRETMTNPEDLVLQGSGILYLKNKNGKITGVVKYDLCNKEIIDKYKWFKSYHGYAVTSTGLRMHRLITKAKKGLFVDHINHDKLDNRKENLRLCTSAENTRNRKKQHGLRFRKDRNKWVARIMVNYKAIHLGHFDTKEEALFARQNAELKYFGEFGGWARD